MIQGKVRAHAMIARCIAIWGSVLFLLVLPARAEIPGANFKDAYTDRQSVTDAIDFYHRRLVDSYAKLGSRNEKWDARAIAYFLKNGRCLAYATLWPGFRPDDLPTPNDLARLGAELVTTGCDDPLVRYCYALSLSSLHRDADAVVQFRFVLDPVNGRPFPPEIVLTAARHLREYGYLLKPKEEGMLRDLTESECLQLAREVPEKMRDRVILFGYYEDAVRSRRPLERRVCASFAKLEGGDRWFVELALGHSEMTWAWEVRGNEDESKVKPEVWKAYEEHLLAAREHLLNAWHAAPMLPGPARRMITIVLAGGPKGDETLRKWFVHALQAKLDDQSAFHDMLLTCRPDYGGSPDEMLSLAQEAADTERFDTILPAEYLLTIPAIAVALNDPPQRLWGDEKLYRQAERIFEQYETSRPEGKQRDWFRSWHAALAWEGGKYDAARRLLDQLTTPPAYDRFAIYGDDPRLTVSEIYAMTNPTAARAKKAEADLEAGRVDAALRQFQDLAAQEHGPSEYYLAQNVQSLQAETTLKSGQWLDVMPKQSIWHFWQPMAGNWTIDPQGELVGAWDEAGLLLKSKLDLENRYEVQATMEYEQANPKEPTGAGLAFDHNGQTSGTALVFSNRFKDFSYYVNFKGVAVSEKILKVNEIHAQFWDDRFLATLNGKPLKIPMPTGKVMHVGGKPRLAIYSLYPGSNVTLRVKSIKVRLLDRIPRELEMDGN